MTSQKVFNQNLDKFAVYFEKQGAVITGSDESGDYSLIDPSKVDAQILSTYNNLLSYGYANGLI